MPTVESHIIGTTAPAGSGKTYRRGVHYLVTEFLPSAGGVHYSNFPLHVDKLCEYAAKRSGHPVELLRQRVELIEPGAMADWRAGKGGPWDYFRDVDLQGCRVAIDEFHKVCSRHHPKAWRKRWGEWFGEIRHRGAKVEIISQNPRKVAAEVWDEAGARIVLANGETRRDPWFRIAMSDWYELRAGWLTGEYQARVWEFEKREVDGRWVTEDARTFPLDPELFPLYDSYSRPEGESTVKADAGEREYQRRGKLSLLGWFVRRNWYRLLPRLAFAGLIAFGVGGGGRYAMSAFLWSVRGFVHSPTANVAAGVGPNKPVAGPVAGAGGQPKTSGATPATPVPSTQPSPVEVELRRELAEAQSRADDLQRRFDRLGDVVLVAGGAAQFRDGQLCRPGEFISEGPYAGHRIAAITRAGDVCMDDGRVLRLGGHVAGLRPDAAVPAAAPAAATAVRAAGGDRSAAVVRGRLPAGDAGGQRNAAVPAAPVRGPTERPVGGVLR